MSSLIVSTHVAAPIEQAFEVFTDLGKAVERIPDITALEVLSDAPPSARAHAGARRA